MWLVLSIGLIVCLSLAFIIAKVLVFIHNAFYDRSGLENVTKQRFGENTFDDIVQDELLISSFEFNSF